MAGAGTIALWVLQGRHNSVLRPVGGRLEATAIEAWVDGPRRGAAGKSALAAVKGVSSTAARKNRATAVLTSIP